MSFRVNWLLSFVLAILTSRLLPAQSSTQIPDYMYPVLNDAGRMSIAAYGNDKQLVETLRQEGWGTPIQVDFPSGLHVGVWERNLPDGNTERIVAFVGTKDLAGIAADLSQGLVGPQMTAQYRDGLDFALKQVAEKDQNPRLSVTFTGHSLGGAIAEQVNLDTGVRTVVFNPAPLNGLDALLEKDRSGQASVAASDLWNLRTKGDIVSALPLANQYGRSLSFDAVRPTTGQWEGDYSTHGVEALLDSINATRTTSAASALSRANSFQASQVSSAIAPRVDFSELANNVDRVDSLAGVVRGVGGERSTPRFPRLDFGINAQKRSIYDNDWSWAAIGAGASALRGPAVTNAAGQFDFLTVESGRVVNANKWATWEAVGAGKFLGNSSTVVGTFASFVPVFAENEIGSDEFYQAYFKAGANTSGAILGSHIGTSLGLDTGPFAVVAIPALAYIGGKAGDFVDWASIRYGASFGAQERAQIVAQWSWATSRGQTSSTLSAWIGGRAAALNAGFSPSELDRLDALVPPPRNPGRAAEAPTTQNRFTLTSGSGQIINGTNSVSRVSSSSFNDPMTTSEWIRSSASYSVTFNGALVNREIGRLGQSTVPLYVPVQAFRNGDWLGKSPRQVNGVLMPANVTAKPVDVTEFLKDR